MNRILYHLLNKLLNKCSRIIYALIPREIKSYINTSINPNKINSINNKLYEKKDREVLEVFETHLEKSIRCTNRGAIRQLAIEIALSNASDNSYKDELFYLEFGVWKGESANFFSKYVDKFYAFDSFKGLPEDWEGRQLKGRFNLDGKIPKLNSNVFPIVGYVENTLDDFLRKYNPKIMFVHIDMDLYNPTKFTLEKIKPYLAKDAIILFDELYNYINWKEGEYKALKEVFRDDEYIYKSFNINDLQAFIQVI